MIKNLLFDLGGVIMNLDRDRCVRAFEALGMRDADEFLGVYGQKGAFLALERGDIDADEFRREIRPLFDREVTDEEIDSAFNQFLTGIPQERLRALRQLRKRYGVYLLSNTNPIMMNGFIAEQFRQEEGMEMKDYFDGVVASYVAKCYKPDREIFDYACEKCGIKPEETLFFDDSQANVDAARALGFYAELVAPGTEFTEILSRR
ncbi:HAD family phosphatase [Duncaniella freteri]|jgi:putative hydrolase of the HAD superfamily|uniref:HAD family phosphatase n=2 Tax=Duncaniella TaxID=2518495 RepID=A0A4Z0V9M6_9BACT|nr:HAD family phosphatase [Duncaniella freteri]MDE7027472.1 HAD family phosphatase [Duncaniella freteri]TGG40253.1 HAD family phosphatase [Duncaniella freteri]